MPFTRILPATVLAALLAAASGNAVAGDRGRGDKERGANRGRGLSAAQAGEIARHRTGGRVLAVTAHNGGFRVKVLTPGGEVRQVIVPGR